MALTRSGFSSMKNVPVIKKSLIPLFLFIICLSTSCTTDLSVLEKFSLDGSDNLLEEKDFGIINGKITAGINYKDVSAVAGIWAPPYVASNFRLSASFFGERVKSDRYKWYPMEVQRSGTTRGVDIKTSTSLLPGERGAIIHVSMANTNKKNITVPIHLDIEGGIESENFWDFMRPAAKKNISVVENGNIISIKNDSLALVMASDIPGLTWSGEVSDWSSNILLVPGEQKDFYVSLGIGMNEEPYRLAKYVLRKAKQSIEKSREEYASRIEDLFTRVPEFKASNKKLENYYNRSLVNFLLNKWDVDEFLLKPYYGTGSILGGCVANYLWDFGMAAQLFPLVDAEASKEHIKQFLRINIYRHFLFDPLYGEGRGPWYPANQEKIIGLIYYYVKHTGDVAFLKDTVDGISVLDHVVNNAMFGDPGAGLPQKLYDYGVKGEHHLELRKGFPYHGVMPDLNGQRYNGYMRAYELSALTGRPLSYLPERAAALKILMKNELWSEEDRWFYFDNGKKQLRWTNIMFMLINSPVLDKEEREGLISHLNEKEFLGEYGIHSISKLDPAFDQDDIDHGGGGSYVSFPPIIVQKLYNEGYYTVADSILQRYLWLGDHLAYWGDSHVANQKDYRHDTPLMSAFDATAGAACIIFGVFGVQVDLQGNITINPHPPSFSQDISLKGLKIRNYNIDITANPVDFIVHANGQTYYSKTGTPVILKK